MTLFESMMRPVCMCRIVPAPDGEGGQTESCECGCWFRAAITRDGTSAVNAADGREEAARYTVTADRELRFGDVVGVHGNDSCVKYRILSDSISPPVCATFGFHQSVAEVLR